LNSLTGVDSTLVNVYGSQQGTFSVTMWATIAVTSVSYIICDILTIVYSNFKLNRVKKHRRRDLGRESELENNREGIVERIAGKRETNQSQNRRVCKFGVTIRA
jgi:hypothetical protein